MSSYKICIDFSSCNDMNGVVERYDFHNEYEIAEWISEITNHFKICKDDSLLEKYAILPNNHGICYAIIDSPKLFYLVSLWDKRDKSQ